MKNYLASLSFMALLSFSSAYAAEIVYNVNTQNLDVESVIDVANRPDFQNVDVEAKINTVTLTVVKNQSSRIISDIYDGRTYTITGYAGGKLDIDIGDNTHALTLGPSDPKKTPNAKIVFDIDTTVYDGSIKQDIAITNDINIDILRNFEASSSILFSNNYSKSTVVFGREDSSDSYTASFSKIDASSMSFVVNKNYTVNAEYGTAFAKSIVVNGGTFHVQYIGDYNYGDFKHNTGSIVINSGMVQAESVYSSGDITIKSNGKLDLTGSFEPLVQKGGNVLLDGGTISTGDRTMDGLKFTDGATFEFRGGVIEGKAKFVWTDDANIKLYSDLTLDYIRVVGNKDVNITWDGKSQITLTGQKDSSLNLKGFDLGEYDEGTGKFNMILDGFDWDSDKFYVGNITQDELEERLGYVQIGNEKYDWGEVLVLKSASKDGLIGFFINSIIPEPSEYATMFGLIAMAFAMIRRRRK